jgi:DNA invertase Pin-like site-specific DNA recombinase
VNGKYVSYIRVSTQKQGRSGLGLAAQRETINAFLNGGRWTLVSEHVEVESGKNGDRPKLAEALAMCRLHRATLLVAKLDRLARNVRFIAALMESGVKFRAVDMPEVSEMVVHILASVAQGEARAISDRTKAALAAAKARGTSLGGLRVSRERWDRVAAKGRAEGTARRSQMASEWAADVLPIIREIKRNGAVTLREIAVGLTMRGIETRRGAQQWSAVQVARVMEMAKT